MTDETPAPLDLDAIRADRARIHYISDGTRGSDRVGRLLNAVSDLIAEVERLRARGSDEPGECVMTHVPPFDFAQCETHDEAFPLGGTCRFHGRTSISEVYADEADQMRARAVLAEAEVERLRAATVKPEWEEVAWALYGASKSHPMSHLARSQVTEAQADAVLDLWPGRTEAEVRAEAWDEGYGTDEESGMPRANPYRKEADRG